MYNVCTCMYVVCPYTCMYYVLHTYIHTTYIHTYIHTFIHTCTYGYVHIHTYIHTSYIHTYIMYQCKHVYHLCSCVVVCTHVLHTVLHENLMRCIRVTCIFPNVFFMFNELTIRKIDLNV